MNRSARNKKGQSMVEYAIGIGAVAAVCMVALGSLGHISGKMINKVKANCSQHGILGMRITVPFPLSST